MNKFMLAMISAFMMFSVSTSYAELTNYFVKQEQAKAPTKINKDKIDQSTFKTGILNVDLDITNK